MDNINVSMKAVIPANLDLKKTKIGGTKKSTAHKKKERSKNQVDDAVLSGLHVNALIN